ncbi:hypothetical protein, partial [Neisseria sicca]|uniref:hypothetical protein n=1 Tax=Neisseria sicca TaxID=490 RepID=UPI003F68A15F
MRLVEREKMEKKKGEVWMVKEMDGMVVGGGLGLGGVEGKMGGVGYGGGMLKTGLVVLMIGFMGLGILGGMVGRDRGSLVGGMVWLVYFGLLVGMGLYRKVDRKKGVGEGVR